MYTTVECARRVLCHLCTLYTAGLQVVYSFLSDVRRAVFIFFSHTTRARAAVETSWENGRLYILLYYNDCDVTAPSLLLVHHSLSKDFFSFLLYCFFDQIHLLAHKCTNNITLKRCAYNFLLYLHLLFTRTLVKSMYLFIYDNNVYCTCGFRDF